MQKWFVLVTTLASLLARSAMAQMPAEIDDQGFSLPLTRLNYFYSRRTYPKQQLPPNFRLQAWLRARQLPVFPPASKTGIGLESTGDWEFWGPSATNAGWLARVNAILVHPTTPGTVYVGSAKGGVWKSTDYGASWTNLTDAITQYVGCLAFDPLNPDIVYLGTGEEYYTAKSIGGVGIYRSTDAGATWTLYGNAMFAGLRINEIVIDPTNTNRWIVSSDGGIYVTTDGGMSFSLKLSGLASALRMHPTNSNKLYAALGNVFGGAPYNGVYTSNDGGNTWTKITANGLPNGYSVGRIELDICKSNPNVVYVVFGNSSDYFINSIWKTTDGGTTWAPTAYTGFTSYGQTWYDLFIRVDPTDPNVVYMGDPHAWRSTNGGASWTDITFDHVDMHTLAFDPADPQHIYLGLDAGLYYSPDRGASWSKKNFGRGTMEYYALDVHPTDANKVAAGAQDNGTHVRTTTNTYYLVIGGDGFWPAYKRSDPNIVIGEMYYGIAYRSADGGDSFATNPVVNLSGEARVGWSAPLINDLTTPSRFYIGSYRLWRSSADGAAGTWAACSGDLTAGSGVLDVIAVAPSDTNTVYTGSSDGAIFVSTDATAAVPIWNNRSAGLPLASVGGLAVNPADSRIVYVGLQGFGIKHIWKSVNGGTTWTNFSGDLPDTSVNALTVNPLVPSQLIAVTDVGVFITRNNGVNWMRLGNGLPNVPCTCVRANATTRYVSVCTYGRGIWRLPLPTPTVSGTITLPECVNKAQVISFTFRPTDGSGNFTKTVTLSNTGAFSLTNIPPKSYTVHILGGKWLARNVPVNATQGDVSGVEATLLPGDVNGDNRITITDLGLLADAFDTTPTDPDWNANADFNCDGKINITDLGLLADSYGKNGDP
jgi:photosystem II stability/assembly factor-like uncharacterized protein